jgi:RNA polymerase sigma-70 factor (ECF subfamily)
MSRDREFINIYDEYYPKILRYIIRVAGLNEAEDIAQDVFDKVNRGIEGYQGKSKLSNWIYRIATNTIIDRSRSAAYKHATESFSNNDNDDLGAQFEVEDQKTPPTDQIVIKKEMRNCINEYIEKLPPDYKIVIILSELEGKSNKEIAEILEISLGNAKIRLHRARTLLRAVLNEPCDFYYTEQNTLACDRKQIKILPKIPK